MTSSSAADPAARTVATSSMADIGQAFPESAQRPLGTDIQQQKYALRLDGGGVDCDHAVAPGERQEERVSGVGSRIRPTVGGGFDLSGTHGGREFKPDAAPGPP